MVVAILHPSESLQRGDALVITTPFIYAVGGSSHGTICMITSTTIGSAISRCGSRRITHERISSQTSSIILFSFPNSLMLAHKRIHKYTNWIREGFFVRRCSFVHLFCGKLFLLALRPRIRQYTWQNDQFWICVSVKFYLRTNKISTWSFYLCANKRLRIHK